jgi:hypothetical protein
MRKPGPVPDEDAELDRLLARGRLSGAEYDAVEQRIFERIAPRKARSPWAFVAPAVALAAAFALWIGLRSPQPEYAEKGGGTVTGGVANVGCGSGGLHTCRLGDTLMFSVLGNVAPVYIVAYGQALDAPDSGRIWYFPRADGTALRVEAGAGTNVAPEGVRLGPPHVKGRYRVTVRLSEAALGREQAATLEGPAQSFDIDVVD